MTKKQWGGIEYFNVDEKWGDPYQMNYGLVAMLDKLRHHLRYMGQFIVHCGHSNGTGHSANSYHYKGQAVDFHVRLDNSFKKNISEEVIFTTIADIIEDRWWFGGVGVYPEWHNPGFHLDIGEYRRWTKIAGSYIEQFKGKL